MVSGLWLLAAVHPLLAVVPLFAVPSLLLVPRAQRHVDDANAAAAEHARAATQLHRLFVTPAAAMELRVFGAQDALDRRAGRLWRFVARLTFSGASRAALVSSAGWAVMTLGYVAALLFVAHEAVSGRATPGDVVLVSQLAVQLRGNLAQTTTVTRQAAAALRTADRFLWLEDVAADQRRDYQGRAAAPRTLRDGVCLDHVSFTYPHTHRPVLSDVCLFLPAGATVAIVGENGAGKTSLVKLLAGLYRPTEGRVLVDGTDLRHLDIEDWRGQLAAGFQDFLRLEALARHSVGTGNPPFMDDDTRVRDALDRASSLAMVDRWPSGLDSHLGKTYRDGVELSGGQWQRVAIARAMMRPDPLCLILDEPTAALDPAGEHALYERYAGAARSVCGHGGITVVISHRFSSVRMADLIVVLEEGRVTEQGSHAELLAAGRTYASMYRQQGAAYG